MKPINRLYLSFEWKRIRDMPLSVVVTKICVKVMGLTVGTLLLPITLLLHKAGYRHVTIFTDRIGHLALEPDCLLKEQSLGFITRRRWILLARPNRTANEHLLNYLRPHFIVVRDSVRCFLVESMSRWGLMRHNVSHYLRALGAAQVSYKIYNAWGERPAILQLSPDDLVYARKKLKTLGLPDEAWFVCVHAREEGFSPVDEVLQRHRNSDIRNTNLAMEEVVRRGGWVIRIGDPAMYALSDHLPNVIDYAHSPLKSARMDIALCALARFTLGNTSGIALVSTVFGVPCAITNAIPTGTLWFRKDDCSIPKTIWSKNEQRPLRIDELLMTPCGSFQYAEQFEKSGLIPVENSPQDIWRLVCFMFEVLEESYEYSDAERVVAEYVSSLFSQEHYAFGSLAQMSPRYFLDHLELLPSSLHQKLYELISLAPFSAKEAKLDFDFQNTNPLLREQMVQPSVS